MVTERQYHNNSLSKPAALQRGTSSRGFASRQASLPLRNLGQESSIPVCSSIDQSEVTTKCTWTKLVGRLLCTGSTRSAQGIHQSQRFSFDYFHQVFRVFGAHRDKANHPIALYHTYIYRNRSCSSTNFDGQRTIPFSR